MAQSENGVVYRKVSGLLMMSQPTTSYRLRLCDECQLVEGCLPNFETWTADDHDA